MSSCKIITFEKGKPSGEVVYPNSWGGAARIWDAMFNRYLNDDNEPHKTWLMLGASGISKLWVLADREDLPRCERAVHAATFDRALVRRENFADFANDLRAFVVDYPVVGKVCHLRAWADFVDTCEAEAIGFQATTVSDNLWYTYDEETDTTTPYDYNEQNEHLWVYEYIAQKQDGEQSQDPRRSR